jgi:hypothetical protein
MRAVRTYAPALVSGVVGAFVGAALLGGGAYAATGGTFILGKANTETTTATLTNSAGTPLSLVAKTGLPALKVSNTVKITNLNADRLNGRTESQFALAGGQFASITSSGSTAFDFNNDGTNDSQVTFATCPAGTQLVSGGADQDHTTVGYTPTAVLASTDAGQNEWVVVTQGTASHPIADAICYNPRGSVPGGLPTKS